MLDLPEPLKIDKNANNVNLHIVVHIIMSSITDTLVPLDLI